jgi:hypothetical protein
VVAADQIVSTAPSITGAADTCQVSVTASTAIRAAENSEVLPSGPLSCIAVTVIRSPIAGAPATRFTS